MDTKIEREVRFLKMYTVVATLIIASATLAFAPRRADQSVQEITAKRIRIVDANGKVRVMLASDYKRDNSAGVYFFNQDGTESGAINYNARLNNDGVVEAYSILTMDQFKNDEVLRLSYNQFGNQKRYGLAVSDKADSLTARAQKVLDDLRIALQAAKNSDEARSIRGEYLSRVPGRELGAQRLFVGRDLEGASLVTLSDIDGKPRLRLQVDKLGRASIAFLDESGQIVKTIEP
jgi:hypothetical protein